MVPNETIRPLAEAPAQDAVEAMVVTDVITPSIQSKEDVITRLQELAQQEEPVDKSELDVLKQTFQQLRNAEVEVARKAFEEEGGKPEDFVAPQDEWGTKFKEIMGSIREKRDAKKAEEEQEKLENLAKKQNIIERIKALAESAEDANKVYPEFKKLQAEWNEIKNIPVNKANELWKSYQLFSEKFYDVIRLNNEFREYDFKKNLEAKLHLCEAAEKLATEKDVVSAFHQLQKLHQEFRETGPVAKEQREEIWQRFKTASSVVNHRHQEYFETIREKEQRNLDEKIVICEIVEAIEYDQLKNYQDWNDKTEEVLALQAKWKTIGFAPMKVNAKIFDRFRAACDEFFKRKYKHFKEVKSNMGANLEKKKQLCERAEALKNSTDWKETSEVLVKLQKEWREVGPVNKKYSEQIWKRFIKACDYFFEQKSKSEAAHRSNEQENMEKKKAIILKLKALDKQETPDENEVRELMKEWNNVGHVPYKEKDRLHGQYRAAVDALFDKLNLSASQKKLSNFKSSINKEGNLYREREKLVRLHDNLKNEIMTYENNLGFLNSSSKKANNLLTEVNRKIEKLKADLNLILEKIAVIDETIKE